MQRRVWSDQPDMVNNLGTGSQSLKPFIVEGNGVVATDLTFSFDGLMVLKEEDAASWAEAVIQYSAYVQRFDESLGERVELDDVGFNGMAAVRQTGIGDNFTINIPEEYWAGVEGEDNDTNRWYDNNNLSIKRVVADGAVEGEINVGDLLAGDTKNQAELHLAGGRYVYYLVYEETFNFNANAGETYYVYMDLSPAVNAGGNIDTNTFALADFSNTITYNLLGGDAITTMQYFDNEFQGTGGSNVVKVGSANAFGGASTLIVTNNAEMSFDDNHTLNENFRLQANSMNTFDTGGNEATLAGNIRGEGGLEKTGVGMLILSGTENSYSGGTLVAEGTLRIGDDDILPFSGNLQIDNGAELDVQAHTQNISGILSGSGTIKGTGNIIAQGIVRPGNSIGTLTVEDVIYTQVSGSTLEVEVNNAGASDKIVTAGIGSVVIEAGAVLKPVVLEKITTPQTYTFISDANGIVGEFTEIEDNYALYNFSIEKTNANQDYDLTVDKVSYNSVVNKPAAKGVASAFDTIIAGAVPASIQTILDGLDEMSTDEINAEYQKLAPDVTGGGVAAANKSVSMFQNLVGGRMSSVRGGGVAAGNAYETQAVWGQVLGGKSKQRNKSGQNGYNADSFGMTLGFDKEISANNVMGLAYGYSLVNSNSASSGVDVDGHTIMIYGSHNANEGWFADAMLSYGFYDYDSNRDTIAGIARGSYRGNQIASRLDIGNPIEYNKETTVTPIGSVRYSRVSLNSYQETGAPGANLAMDSQSFNNLTAAIGAKVASRLEQDSEWVIKPELKAAFAYDISNSKMNMNSRFVDAGPAFKTEGLTPARSGFELGLGMVFEGANGLDITVNYDSEYRSKYDSHSGVLKLRKAF